VTTEDADQAEVAAALERGRWLFAQDCRFRLGAHNLSQMPDDVLPEVAFAGRSNVGKSSLVNALTGRNTLAKVSNTPGRTRELNFFVLAERLSFVDLPGYGHAEVSKKQVAGWTNTIYAYLKGRVPLRRVFLLIDSRHGLKTTDEPAMKLMDESAVVYQVVLTKADKIKPAELAETKAKVEAALSRRVAAHPIVLATSSETGLGIPELRAEIAGLLNF